MKRKGLALLALCLIGGAALAAVTKGGKLYVRARDTHLQESATSSKSKAVLQPGDEVVWKGADKAKGWHQVEFKGKSGVVIQSSLSPSKPNMELLAKEGKEIDPQAFASSGAATKALSEAGDNYAKEINAQAEAAKLKGLETMAKGVTPKAVKP